MKVTGLRRTWKTEEFQSLKPTVYDWCRMAAFLDGEGCLRIDVSSRKSTIKLVITNTSEDLILWLDETFGGSFYQRTGSSLKASWKPVYSWNASAARAAWILDNCKPWLIIKGKQAEVLLEYQQHLDDTFQNRYQELPEETMLWRSLQQAQIKRLNMRGVEIKDVLEEVNGVRSEL